MADEDNQSPREATPECSSSEDESMIRESTQSQEQFPPAAAAQSGSANLTPGSSSDPAENRPVAVAQPLPRVNQPPPRPQQRAVGEVRFLLSVPGNLPRSLSDRGIAWYGPIHARTTVKIPVQVRPMVASEPAQGGAVADGRRISVPDPQPSQSTSGPQQAPTRQPGPSTGTPSNARTSAAPTRRSSSRAQGRRAKRPKVFHLSDACQPPRSPPKQSCNNYSEDTSSSDSD